MAKLYFRYGAMGSSKTANAIMVQYNYRERGQSALLVKPAMENRDGARIIASRSGLSAPCVYIEDLTLEEAAKHDCIIVDEAQFLTKEQVEKLVLIVDDLNVPVVAYGLRADFQGNLFEGSHWLLAWADSIEEVKTVCWCGKKATWNARIADGKVVKTGAQIQLGGNESYTALCRKHWLRGELKPSPFIFRTIRQEEAEQAVEIEKICFPPNEACKREYMIPRIAAAADFFWVAEDHGRIAGFINGIATNEECFRDEFFTDASIHDSDGKNVMILGLDVLPEYRGRGLGRELMRTYSEQMKGRRLVLTCLDHLVGMYRKMGFRDLGLSASVWGGETWHEMEK